MTRATGTSDSPISSSEMFIYCFPSFFKPLSLSLFLFSFLFFFFLKKKLVLFTELGFFSGTGRGCHTRILCCRFIACPTSKCDIRSSLLYHYWSWHCETVCHEPGCRITVLAGRGIGMHHFHPRYGAHQDSSSPGRSHRSPGLYRPFDAGPRMVPDSRCDARLRPDNISCFGDQQYPKTIPYLLVDSGEPAASAAGFHPDVVLGSR